jgi:eukaryotic-like serine/threonine-protein kinase
VMHYPDYIAVGVAVVISYTFTVLRAEANVTRAGELGSYQLGELLGKGGMGEVYRARHRHLARPAAIKLIRSDQLAGVLESERVLSRFRREAEIIASLRSPHTVALYDFGVAADRRLYLVMELLEGVDLQALVEMHGPQPPHRVVHFLLQIAASLEEAHARGLVHRDIKPANVHIGRHGLEHDFLKVLDFGIAKAPDDVITPEYLRTGEGQTPCTPAYMAPEVALGEPSDSRSDLYALGCLAFFALTGRLVFQGATSFEIVTRHLKDVPLAPSSFTSLVVPAELDQLVLACLAKDPRQRPPSAAAFAEALRGVPLAPWTEDDARVWWEQHGVDAPRGAQHAPTASTLHTKGDVEVPDERAARAGMRR